MMIETKLTLEKTVLPEITHFASELTQFSSEFTHFASKIVYSLKSLKLYSLGLINKVLRHILYLLASLFMRGVEKFSGATLGLGKGVGVLFKETLATLLMASDRSSGRFEGCDDEEATRRFSAMVLSMFLPASFAWWV